MEKIKFDNVCKDFALPGKGLRKVSLHANKNIRLTIKEGTTLAIVGESGSGKSTLARLLMKLHQPTSGAIYVDGEDIDSLTSKQQDATYRSKIQMIFQDPFASLNPAHTIKYIIGRAITLHNKEISADDVNKKVRGLLEVVGLNPTADYMGKHPSQLSGGQRQRIGIARALAVDPSILVADEPTSMLDVSIGIDIMNLLMDLREKQKLTMLYITHNLAAARYMADYMAVMYAGTCVEYGDIDDIVKYPCHPYTILLLNSTPEPFRKESLVISASEVPPDLVTDSPQCMFSSRCPVAEERCFTNEPPEVVLGERRVKCFLYENRGENYNPLLFAKMYT